MAKPVKRLGAIELLIFVAGLAVSVAVFFQMKNSEKKQAGLAFEAESAERVGQVNRRITDLLYSLKSIQHGQQTMGELSREGFSKLARSGLSSSPELEELAYVPIVTSAERADLERGARRDGLEEFRIHDERGHAVEGGTTRPLLFIEPTPKSTRFGQDLAKDPEFIRVAQKATASGEATALASHRAEDAEGKHTRGTLLAPIYDPDGATSFASGACTRSRATSWPRST